LGTSLCQCKTRADCALWRDDLSAYLQTKSGRRPAVPPEFPNIKTLDKYNRPKVSTDEQLLNLRGLRHGWDAPLDEMKLLELTSSRFNIWGRLYMNWIGPVLLTKFLVVRDAKLPKEHVHQIKITKQRVKKDITQPVSPPLLRSLCFSPFALTTLKQKDFEGERAGYWTSRAQEPFEPEHVVKAEIPANLLQRVLPSNILDPPFVPKSTSRKRKRPEVDVRSKTTPAVEIERLPMSRSKRVITQRLSGGLPYLESPTSGLSIELEPPTAQHSEITRPMPPSAEYISLLSDSEEDASPSQRRSSVIDLGESPPESEDEDEDLARAIQLSSKEPSTTKATSLLFKQKQSNRFAGVAWQEIEAYPENFLLQPPVRTEESSNVMTPKSSDSASRLYPTSSSAAIGGHTLPGHTRPPSDAVMSMSLVDGAEKIPGSGTAEVRAARLRFFASNNTEAKATPEKNPLSMQDASISSSQEKTASCSVSLDIETIDLT
jgi:Holliday junction resolvase YEN1